MARGKILVTGAGGFLGGYVLEELNRSGYEARATDLPGSDFNIAEKLGVEIIPSNLLDYDSLLKAVKGVDTVIHLGGIFQIGGQRQILFDVNVRGTENICRAALKEGVGRFVHFSSIAVYAHPESLPIDEDSPKEPHDTYGMTKLWAEKVAFRYYDRDNLPLICLRPGVAYGPRGKYVAGMIFAGGMIVRNLGLKTFRLFEGGLHTSWAHSEDIAGAAVFLLEKDEAVGKAFNISDDTPACTSDVLKKMLELYGIEVKAKGKYHKDFADSIIKFLARTPDSLDVLINRRLQKFWDRVVVKYNLEPALQPSFTHHLMLFFSRDYVISNKRIKNLGYRLRHPDFFKGFDETADWYCKMRWIPDLRTPVSDT